MNHYSRLLSSSMGNLCSIRVNEIKAINLIEHYKTEIDTQTKLAISL